MGQAKVLQVFTPVVEGQGTHPWPLIGVIMERVRILVPEAQVAEQVVNAFQLVHTQSTQQAQVLQFCTTVRVLDEAIPPYMAAVMTERDLVLVPVPQVLVQAE
jgi:hypothetical protein